MIKNKYSILSVKSAQIDLKRIIIDYLRQRTISHNGLRQKLILSCPIKKVLKRIKSKKFLNEVFFVNFCLQLSILRSIQLADRRMSLVELFLNLNNNHPFKMTQHETYSIYRLSVLASDSSIRFQIPHPRNILQYTFIVDEKIMKNHYKSSKLYY